MSDAHPEFSDTVQLRFRDVDAYQHVNNAAYLTILETARVRFLHATVPADKLSRTFMVVARIEIDFKKPLFLQPEVTVRFGAKEIRRSSFTMWYQITDATETIYAEALTRMVVVDETKTRPAPIPPWFREVIE